ncbi:MAG TPA: hypothetical protein VMS21_04485 [Methylomirabilota bacterium]|nr:hypothetical protein [Methylomirabilota bacterium]
MSLYATLWTLQFPKEGDEHSECEWIKVRAQAVLAHAGSPVIHTPCFSRVPWKPMQIRP